MGDAHEVATKTRQINAMKKQLKGMLSKPIATQLFTSCYPTKSGKLVGPTLFREY